jgi:uncharacterized Zn-binding protein involved in type VI secretion
MPGMPAARLGDMHTCAMCMGAPMPILPPCAPTVLIGKQPAARLTDLCSCVAPIPVPVDPIIFGSPTVLICGLPAARVADPTAKGGLILPPGCPTVLIGLAGVVAPGGPNPPVVLAQAVFEKEETKAEKMLVDLAPKVPNPICVTLAALQRENAAARDDAMLAAAVYSGPEAPLPENTTRAELEDLVALGLHDGVHDLTRIADSNFRAGVFSQIDPITRIKTYIIAFKGTDAGSLEDWLTNLAQGLGRETPYYNQAMEIARTAQAMAPDKVRYVGHSLGGGLASAAAAAARAEARTFNAAGVNAATLARKGAEALMAKAKAYFVDGDILSALQDVLPMAEAMGRRVPMPPAVPPPSSLVAQAAGAVMGALAGPVGALLGAVGADKAAQGLALHGMEQVQAAVAAEGGRIAADQAKHGCN